MYCDCQYTIFIRINQLVLEGVKYQAFIIENIELRSDYGAKLASFCYNQVTIRLKYQYTTI